MKILNKHNLPKVLEKIAHKDEYDNGGADYSVTELLLPPQICVLRRRFGGEIKRDVTDLLWSLLGTAVHKLIEEAVDNESLSEERLFTEIDGWTISGGVDWQKISDNSVDVVDFKVTSCRAVIYDKAEWEQQLNIYGYLIQLNKGLRVNKLNICAILRDWNESDTYKKDYPKAPIIMLDIPLWSYEEAEAFVKDRLNMHINADMQYATTKTLPKCSASDRWQRSSKWAVTKGNGRASRVFNSKAEAIQFSQKDDLYQVEERPSTPMRCQRNYCNVADFCQQWREMND